MTDSVRPPAAEPGHALSTGPPTAPLHPAPAPPLLPAALRKAQTVLKKTFGHRTFRPGQAEVMQRLLTGRSTLALLPTGGGKSLCYQIPALLLPGPTLVISPLLALVRDQVGALQERGVAAARLDSTQSAAEQEAVQTALLAGTIKLLYLSPERLMHPGFAEVLRQLKPALIAIDEAHCLAEWGHAFRPDYLRLGKLRQLFPDTPWLALTATATPTVAAAIRHTFGIAEEDQVQTSFQRPNLRLRVTPTAAAKRPALLAKRLTSAKLRPAIVYVTRQETAESVATALQRCGCPARAYHAGLPDDQRAEAQDAFLSGVCPVMVATVAFGMGIDLPGVRAVFHYDLPRSLENYLQETGRAGRDGKSAHCEVLASAEDLTVLENSIRSGTPTTEALRSCLDTLLRQGSRPSFSRWQLSRAADIRPAVLDTVLTHLEMAGILTPLSSSWLSCRVKLLRREEQLAAGHPPQHQAWIRHLLVKKEKVWGRIPVDLVAAAADLESTPEELAQFLRDLETGGDLLVQPREREETWQLHAGPCPPAPRGWLDHFSQSGTAHEAASLQRLQQTIGFLTFPGCLTRHLLAHFGESAPARCGHCERCLHPDRPPVPLPAAPVPTISTEAATRIQALIQTRLPALRHPRQLARFLCGLSSPAALRDRLTKHGDYALLAGVPFDDVLAHCTASM